MKKLIAAIFILVLLFVIRNLSLSLYDLIQTEDTVKDLRKELKEKERENKFLNQKLSYIQSAEFIEKEARNKLGLVKNNEHPVFVSSPTPLPEIQESKQEPNWKKWMKIFKL